MRTVTFAALKPGLLLEPGRSLAGEVVVADIGLDVVAPRGRRRSSAPTSPRWLPARAGRAHKWRAGVLVVAGSPGMTGAAHLAAAAAQRAGAGMVRLGSPGRRRRPGRPTEAVGVGAPGDGLGRRRRSRRIERLQAIVVGPGLGTATPARSGVRGVLAAHRPPCRRRRRRAHRARRGRRRRRSAPAAAATVLTPHDGEYERLAGAPPGRRPACGGARAGRGAPARSCCSRARPPSSPTRAGTVRVVADGDARLATAGTGDVLSGIIGALLAQGLPAARGGGRRAPGCTRRAGGARSRRDGLVASDLVDAPARRARGGAGRSGHGRGPRCRSARSPPTSRPLRARRRARRGLRGGEGRRLRPRRRARGPGRARGRGGLAGRRPGARGHRAARRRHRRADPAAVRAPSRPRSTRRSPPGCAITVYTRRLRRAARRGRRDAGRRPVARPPQGRHGHAPRRRRAGGRRALAKAIDAQPACSPRGGVDPLRRGRRARACCPWT